MNKDQLERKGNQGTEQRDQLDDEGRQRHMGRGDERDDQGRDRPLEEEDETEEIGDPVWVEERNPREEEEDGRKEQAAQWDDKSEGTSRQSGPVR